MEENPSSSRSSSQLGGTPRETQFYSPRDDRFVSPRQEALRSSRTASSDEKWDNNAQWSTPREENRVMRASSSEKMTSDHWSTPRSDRPSPRHPYPLQRQSSNSSDEFNSARSEVQQYDDRNNMYNNHYQSSQPYYSQQQPQPPSSSGYMLQPQASPPLRPPSNLSKPILISTTNQTLLVPSVDDECTVEFVDGQFPDFAELGVPSSISRSTTVSTTTRFP